MSSAPNAAPVASNAEVRAASNVVPPAAPPPASNASASVATRTFSIDPNKVLVEVTKKRNGTFTATIKNRGSNVQSKEATAAANAAAKGANAEAYKGPKAQVVGSDIGNEQLGGRRRSKRRGSRTMRRSKRRNGRSRKQRRH